jgi:hypothetical protein
LGQSSPFLEVVSDDLRGAREVENKVMDKVVKEYKSFANGEQGEQDNK